MRKDLFDELCASVTEAKAIMDRRKTPSRVFLAVEVFRDGQPDIHLLRQRYGLSQAKFAALLGISVDTLQNWEQKRRRPEGPARVLLRIAATHPEALLAQHQGAKKRGRRSAA